MQRIDRRLLPGPFPLYIYEEITGNPRFSSALHSYLEIYSSRPMTKEGLYRFTGTLSWFSADILHQTSEDHLIDIVARHPEFGHRIISMISTMLTTLNHSGTTLPITDTLRIGVATPLLVDGMLGPIISSGLDDVHLEKLLRQHLLQLLVTTCIYYWPKTTSHPDARLLEQGIATMLGALLQGSRHYSVAFGSRLRSVYV